MHGSPSRSFGWQADMRAHVPNAGWFLYHISGPCDARKQSISRQPEGCHSFPCLQCSAVHGCDSKSRAYSISKGRTTSTPVGTLHGVVHEGALLHAPLRLALRMRAEPIVGEDSIWRTMAEIMLEEVHIHARHLLCSFTLTHRLCCNLGAAAAHAQGLLLRLTGTCSACCTGLQFPFDTTTTAPAF